MKTLSVYEACHQLPEMVEKVLANQEPMLISRANKNAVLITESDWQAMNETSFIVGARNARHNPKWLVGKSGQHNKKVKVVMHFRDHSVEVLAQQTQQLMTSDVGVLWLGLMRWFGRNGIKDLIHTL